MVSVAHGIQGWGGSGRMIVTESKLCASSDRRVRVTSIDER